jgi:hypothetical protein
MQTPPYLKSFVVLLVLAGLISLLTLSANSCRHRKAPPADAALQPAFEQNPPIAQSVDIQRLENNDNGNILLTADFGKGVLKDPFHAVMLGEEKIVLRDDGQEGDTLAGDGKFAVVLKEDTSALLQELNRRSRLLRESKTITVFHNRNLRLVPVSQETPAEIARFKNGGILKLDPSLFALPAHSALKDHSLTITAPAVVEDPARSFNPCTGVGNPAGAWAFARLVSEMANTPLTGVQPKDFLMKWLQTWSADQSVNGDLLAKRTNINNVINAWQTLSSGTFDIKFAPFKLIAIVNRLDLRGNSGYGFGHPGEGCFVFCAVDAACHVIRNPAPFMVTFEYGIPKYKCADLKAYAQQWFDLRALSPGSPAYNSALEIITNQFTLANTSPSKPNGSSINQVRTNESALGAREWREFGVDSLSHLLVNSTGPRFITSDTSRLMLSFNTCSGCHAVEGKTGNFMHVAPGGNSGVPAILSSFLTGSPAVREFNDLERRALDLQAFVSSPCVPVVKSLALAQLLTFDPLRMTH